MQSQKKKLKVQNVELYNHAKRRPKTEQDGFESNHLTGYGFIRIETKQFICMDV